MIQDIAPHTYDPMYHDQTPKEEDYLLHYEYNKVMLLREGDGCRLPTFRDLRGEGDFDQSAYYLFLSLIHI